MNKISQIIEKIENYPTNFNSWSISLLGIISLRILIENWLGNFSTDSISYFFFHASYNFLFFIFAYILFSILIKLLIEKDLKKISNFLLFGYSIILLPPLIDHIISRGHGFFSFYGLYGFSELIKRYFTFFGDNPEIGVTYGVRIEIAFSVLSIFFYSYIKTRKINKSLITLIATYTVFFILATFPSWITLAIKGIPSGFLSITELSIAQMFLSPAKIFNHEIGTFINALSVKMSIIYSLLAPITICIGFYFFQKEKLISFLKNTRPPQLLYHGGLLTLGMGLGMLFTNPLWDINFFNILSFFVLLEAVSFAWISSSVVNDIFDQKIDEISNNQRPLVKKIIPVNEYKTIGVILFIFSIWFSLLINAKVAILLIAYQALAWVYSAWPLRLKRFPIIATFISSVASTLIVFSGFIVSSPKQNIENLPFSIILLLLISYTISLSLKDIKDIKGDKNDGVFTIPVIFGEKWGKIIVGSGIFISYLLSVFFLREPRLFWWAILFGGISFWIINYSSLDETKKINHRNLPWWIMAPLIFYGSILIKIIFIQ
ncbi:MAG: UbiA family prenyltransferase [Candidatus Moranbacteria bacterium]|jgi:4-hydroxybenzoate polyprenyltransferase|nr:UbiA family prenyltransferase [Candidatus Moranbacteria bacterium]